MMIIFFRKNLIQGIPLVSMAIGAGANYQLTRKVTEFAHNFYQLRYLREKEEKMDLMSTQEHKKQAVKLLVVRSLQSVTLETRRRTKAES